jgi:hypothetical protein
MMRKNPKGRRSRELVDARLQQALRWVVRQAIAGFGPLASAEALAADYASRFDDRERAIDALVRHEMLKAAGSGFLMGLPGLLAMPITLPANMGADYLLSARLVAVIAKLRGWQLDNDRVQSFIVVCLVGNQGKEVVKSVARVASMKTAQGVLERLSARLVTQASRAVPVVGGVVGGSLDAGFLLLCARAARQVFHPNFDSHLHNPEDFAPDFFALDE